MQKVTPFLCFDNNAHEAMDFYASAFPNAKVAGKRHVDGAPEIDGQKKPNNGVNDGGNLDVFV